VRERRTPLPGGVDPPPEHIEVFYNRKCLHSTLGYTSPTQFLINPRRGKKQVA
jgi:transposase InsO family protein